MIGAKLGLSFVAGAVLIVLALALALVVASFWISLDLESGHWELMGRMVLGAALWGVFGAGLGALMQSQVGAIVTSFVWFLVAEPLLGLALDALTDVSIADYLPGNVIDRLLSTGQPVEDSEGVVSGPDYAFGLWVAALLAGVYAAAFAMAGTVSAVRRDVP